MRSMTIVLGLVLLTGLLTTETSRSADSDEGPKRGLMAPSLFSADATAWVAAGGFMAGAKAVEYGVAEARLNFAKAAQRELGRQHRRDRRAVMRETTGRERECRLAELDLAYQSDRSTLQQAIQGYRHELGYTDRRKGFTKFAAHVKRFVRFVGGIVKETLREGGTELIASLVAGPASRVAAQAILKRRFARVAKDRLAREAISQLTGARSADVLAYVVDKCREEEQAAGGPSAQAPPGQRVNTGPFTVDGVFGYNENLDERQAAAVMGWAGIAGDECADFEAYNPRPDDRLNQKLPGITVQLLLEPAGGSYVGILDGLAESRDLSAGPCLGGFTSVFMGELRPLADGWGWELVPGDGAVSLTYHMEAACGNIDEQWSVGPFWEFGRGTVTIEGTIEAYSGYWWLELEADHEGGPRSFWAGLGSIPLGEVYVDAETGSP